MKTIVFDVNETLLDLGAMGPRFDAVFGSTDLLGAWFDQLLRHALVSTVTDSYVPFDDLAVDALTLVARRSGREVTDEDAIHVVDGMAHLPAHTNVRPAIARLRDHGFTTATLTNSPPHLLRAQLANAAISDLFDATLSIDPVRRFKPHPETYRSAAERLDIEVADMRLVTAHDWDVTGAIRAGAAGAFVARRGMILSNASESPDIAGSDLGAVVTAIIEKDA